MIAYFDTSALAQRYLAENGSDQVKEWLRTIEHLETSALTELELVAVIERARSDRRLDSPNYRKALTEMERDLKEGGIGVIPVESAIVQTAKNLLRVRRLRVGDSIQLASALSCHKRFPGSAVFVCADRPLLEAARLEGLKVLDPAS